jgi:hypothetical protein
MITMRTGVSFAASAALVAIGTAAVPTAAVAKGSGTQVHCYGVNTCKGTSTKACKAAGGSLTEAQ